jgi:cytoskeleton protein RodZ
VDGVGNKLREGRARRRLSLHEVEEATKIRAKYLQALENEDWDLLPGDTYTRAFIRTYGALLGLDGARLAEEQRQQRGVPRPGERLPKADVRPRRGTALGGQRARQRLLTTLVGAVVLLALVIGLLSGGSDRDRPSGGSPQVRPGEAEEVSPPQAMPQNRPPGHTLRLLADGEVWVCLLDGRGEPLVNGSILAPGEAEGPFRSGSFTLALGNGAVTMTVDGKPVDLPEPSSPIGFVVDDHGSIRELPEGERPTCT